MKQFYLFKLLILIGGLFFIPSLNPSFCAAQDQNSSLPGKLPTPTGQYQVGTIVFHLTDKSRKMPVNAASEPFREMMVQVWYPAKKTDKSKDAGYLVNALLLEAMKKERYLNLQPEVLESWQNLQTNSKTDAPIIKKTQKLPLLIFSHGAGISRVNYTTILEELASRGYIVAAIDHPYLGLTVLPDGRALSFTNDDRGPEFAVERVESIAQDALFVLDALFNKKSIGKRFAGSINSEKVGMFGHSLGGAAALEICRSSERFKACADLDGSVWGKVETAGVNRPFLVILNEPAEAKRPPEAMRKQRDDEWAAVISKKKTKAYLAKIKGTFHLSFSDLPFIVPESLLLKNGADIEPKLGLEITTKILLGFFSNYLKNEKNNQLDSIDEVYKEVEIKVYN